jgi:outer membrane protein OmpA-like peptidoglycan-associated protein
VLLALLLLAQAPEANLSLLRPASGSDGLLGVEGARPLDDAENPLELQLGFDAAWLPVRLGPGARVDSRLGGWLQLQARLISGWSLFAQLPATLKESGDLSFFGAKPAFGFGVGDIRLGVRHSLRPDLSAQISLEAPTAPLQSLTGDNRIAVEALVSGARRTGNLEWLGNLFLRFRAPRDVGGALLGNELGLRGGAAWHPGGRFPRRVYAELEVQSSLRGLSQGAFPIEWRAGATVCAGSALALDVAGGTRLDDGLGAPSLRGVVAVRYAPVLCTPPRVILPEPGLEELLARMAQERAAREKAELEERLLAALAPSERDARENLFRAEALDLLAASEADARARAAAFAEEDRRDTDGDGVPDRLDNCPREKGPADNRGCPRAKKQLVVLREDRIEILEKVFFAFGKARIEKRSYKLLEQVAQVLREHPDLVAIEVQGHTDDQGSAKTNTALSQARAAAVTDHLRRRGVAPDRLAARGYGPLRPLAPNGTAAGREKNRRVEFHVLKRRAAREIIEVEEAR